MHVHGFTAGQKTIENLGKSGLTAGVRAVAGRTCGPWAAGCRALGLSKTIAFIVYSIKIFS